MFVSYGENKYVLSEFMKDKSDLIRECISLEKEELVIPLTQFEEEFKLLNSGEFNVNNYNTVEEINHMYDFLGYFGIDSLIKQLNEHLFVIEMTTVPLYADTYYKINICFNNR